MRSSIAINHRPFVVPPLPALLGVLLAIAASGCRSTRPVGSTVQVTEEKTVRPAEIEPPQQRLAMTKIGTSSQKPTIPGKAVKGMPAVFRQSPANAAGTVAQMSLSDQPTASKTGSAVQVASAQKPNAARPSTAVNPAPEKKTQPKPADTEDVTVTIGGLVSASLTDLSLPKPDAQPPNVEAEKSKVNQPKAEDLVAAKTSKEPKVRRRPINQTGQPFSLTAALNDALESLPELPDVAANETGPSPKRIGTAPVNQPDVTGESDDTAVAHVGDDEPSRRMNLSQVKTVSHATSEKMGVSPVSNSPPVTDDLSEEELYERLLSLVAEPKPGESPNDQARRQMIARYLMVLAGDPDSATESIRGLGDSERKFLKNQLDGIWTMIDPNGHPSAGRRITEAVPRFRQAASHLAEATDSLELRHLEFCTEIESYGQIKPFEGNRFSAGQQVILYCEVENFAADEQAGIFQTKLEGSYDIYDSTGTKVVSQLLPTDQQRSRNRLRDYFVAYQMNLPNQLRQGTYRLQLTLEDSLGKKYGQANIPFEIR